MNKEMVQKIKANPKYTELVQKRTSLAVKLGLFVLAMYYVYILTIAFNPAILGTKLSDTGVMTVAFPVAALIIIVSFLTTVVYVTKANNEFEDLTNAIKEDVKELK